MPDDIYVNEATELSASLFSNASNQTFPVENKTHFNGKRSWFGPLCKSARKKNNVVKKRFNSRKSTHNRQLLSEASKHYKK